MEQRKQAKLAAERADIARQARLAEERRAVARKQAAEDASNAAAKAVTTRVVPAPKPVTQQPQDTVKVAQAPPPANAATFEATAYIALCDTGCSGITATGIDVRNSIYAPSGRRIVAVDPSVIPLGSVVVVTLSNGVSFEAEAKDTGGAIRGNRIDILVATHAEAVNFGRQAIKITRK